MNLSPNSSWRDLKKHLNELIEGHRTGLETMTDQTRIHRTQGRIAALRALIADVEPDPGDGAH